MRAMCRSWAPAPMRPGLARPYSTAPARSKASRPISTGTAPGSISPRSISSSSRWSIPKPGSDWRARELPASMPMPSSTSGRCTGPQTGSGGGVLFDPETTNWCLCIYVAPMPAPTGSAITLSPFRRPTMENAPVDCKAACLYPNNSRALIEAQARGFNNCLMLDMLGNVAEFGNSNVFMAKDGVVYTPAPNGTFLNGITRQRVIDLLRADGVTVVETTLSYRRFSARRRNLLKRQFRQGRARHPDRRPVAAAGTVLPAGTQAVLGLCPRLTRIRDRTARVRCRSDRRGGAGAGP